MALMAGLLILGILGLTTTATAQSVKNAVSDLKTHDVTFEDGALTDQDIDELDSLTSRLQSGDGYLKVIVLASPVSTFPSARAYAQQVRATIGGSGRVIVFDPDEVGIASSVPADASKIETAEAAAQTAANGANSYGSGVSAAASALGVSESGSGGSSGGGDGSGGSSGGSSSGGGSILALLIVLAVLGIGALVLYRWWAARKAKDAAIPLGVGEQKVRAEVEKASNLVIDLSDRVELPNTPPAAATAFRDGASEFGALQDDLEAADTRPELEAIYPRLVDANWKLETAKAVLDGQPAPATPVPQPLFPAPQPVPAGPPVGAIPGPSAAPGPHYQEHAHSPWLSNVAMSAITILAARGLANGGRTYRPPSDDAWFGQHYGNQGGGMGGMFGGRGFGGRGGGAQSRPPISMGGGRRSRGMGRR